MSCWYIKSMWFRSAWWYVNWIHSETVNEASILNVKNKNMFTYKYIWVKISTHLGWLSPNTKPFISLLNLVLGRVDSSTTAEFSPTVVFDIYNLRPLPVSGNFRSKLSKNNIYSEHKTRKIHFVTLFQSI